MQITAAPGLAKPREWAATGFDARFVEHGAPKLEDHGGYANDADAYRAVLASPNLAIIEDSFLAAGGGPPNDKVGIGDQFTVQDEATRSIARLHRRRDHEARCREQRRAVRYDRGP